jgi:hypothetical protein
VCKDFTWSEAVEIKRAATFALKLARYRAQGNR